MTIGRSSKKNQTPRAPAFLDRASGFYGRLDEPDTEQTEAGTGTEGQTAERGTVTGGPEGCTIAPASVSGWQERQEPGIFDFNEGMMEDDGTATLLRRRPSSRWSRRSSRKAKTKGPSPGKEDQSPGAEPETAPTVEVPPPLTQTEMGAEVQAPEPALVHFSIREEADDAVLISRRREREMEEKKKKERETEEKVDGEKMKVAKRSTLRNYRKALDRAFRRGWETFVANLYSVTLTPVSSSSSPPSSSSPSQSEMHHSCALAEYR